MQLSCAPCGVTGPRMDVSSRSGWHQSATMRHSARATSWAFVPHPCARVAVLSGRMPIAVIACEYATASDTQPHQPSLLTSMRKYLVRGSGGAAAAAADAIVAGVGADAGTGTLAVAAAAVAANVADCVCPPETWPWSGGEGGGAMQCARHNGGGSTWGDGDNASFDGPLAWYKSCATTPLTSPRWMRMHTSPTPCCWPQATKDPATHDILVVATLHEEEMRDEVKCAWMTLWRAVAGASTTSVMHLDEVNFAPAPAGTAAGTDTHSDIAKTKCPSGDCFETAVSHKYGKGALWLLWGGWVRRLWCEICSRGGTLAVIFWRMHILVVALSTAAPVGMCVHPSLALGPRQRVVPEMMQPCELVARLERARGHEACPVVSRCM